MKAAFAVVVVTGMLGECTAVRQTQAADDALSPQALIRWHETRCEGDTARATPATNPTNLDWDGITKMP